MQTKNVLQCDLRYSTSTCLSSVAACRIISAVLVLVFHDKSMRTVPRRRAWQATPVRIQQHSISTASLRRALGWRKSILFAGGKIGRGIGPFSRQDTVVGRVQRHQAYLIKVKPVGKPMPFGSIYHSEKTLFRRCSSFIGLTTLQA